jgi:streptogramin lyase
MNGTRALLCLVVLGAAGCGGESKEPPAVPVAKTVQVDFEDALESEISTQHPDWPLLARGSIWINRETGEIERIDPRSADVAGAIDTHGYPCQNSVVAAGALWTIDCATSELLRMDPRKHEVKDRISIDGLPRQTFGSIAVAAGRIWVQASGEGGYYLVGIDPETGEAAEPAFVGKEAAGMVASGERLWISNPFEHIVYEFDATTGEVVRTLEGFAQPRWLAASHGSIWVLNEDDGTVGRIDEETGEIQATIPTGDGGTSGYIVAAEDAVWARLAGVLYVRIDPATNEVTHELAGDFGTGGLAIGFGSVWATSLEQGKVWRLSLP